MSTPVGSSQWMYTPASGFYPYLIDQSLRFNDNDSAYLSRTPASAGNRKTFTFSAWIKVNPAATNYPPIFSADNTAPDFVIRLSNTGSLQVVVENGGGGNSLVFTNRLFRDPSSWYHLVVTIDTTNATANDRIKVYVNGVEETSFSSRTNPSLNLDTKVNSTVLHRLGLQRYGSYWDGYMAEVNFIDGTALDATSFGETINGIWVPKAYDTADGAYGTNGFYLSFADSAAIGDDLSGNTNDFTANNLAASDVVPDSPTNNFATFNPLDISGTTLTYSEGNLKAERTSSSFAQAYSSFSFDSGKWYAEFLLDTGNTGVGVIAGTTNPAANRYIGQDTYTYGFHYDGRKINSASYTAYGSAYTRAADGSGDVVGVYIDADNGDIYFSVNGTVQNSGTAAFTGVTGPFRFAIGSESNAFHIANFGQDDSFAGLKTSGSAAASDDNGNGVFYDAIGLSGYLAPCTANLPEPAIGPNSTTTSDQYFNTILYTGDGTTSRSITGVGFAPDFVWGKCRSNAEDHILSDTVRGANKKLESNNTGAEDTSTAATLSGFESDGFTSPSSTPGNINVSGRTYVAWNWKAGGTAVSNTDGSITSQVSANPDAGFSIVSYTGTGANATVGHGLSSAPEMVIVKERGGTGNWFTYHKDAQASGAYVIYLNLTNASAASTAIWNNTQPTDTVFSLGTGNTNTNTDTYIAYCFHSVEGFSKVGSYVGNGSADGTFVYTGFRPAWVMYKTINGTNNHWVIRDNKRDPDNEVLLSLYANLANADDTGGDAIAIDMLSNGFKARRTNSQVNENGTTYIYLAFAESPFKYANAR